MGGYGVQSDRGPPIDPVGDEGSPRCISGKYCGVTHPSSSSGGVGRCVGGGADNTRRCLPPADQYGGGERSDVSSAAH